MIPQTLTKGARLGAISRRRPYYISFPTPGEVPLSGQSPVFKLQTAVRQHVDP